MGKLKPTIEGRIDKLRKTSGAYGLKFEYQNGICRFIKPSSGAKKIMWGLWAAEQFLVGYIFAMTSEIVPSKAGNWRE